MHRIAALFVGLLALVLTGCHAPAAPVGAVVATERPVEARLQLGGYHTQAVVAGYSAADIDHLRLKLMVKNAQGNYQATSANLTVAKAALASPVMLGNLRMGQTYRVDAEAYADAAETQLISAAASSQTEFTVPSLTMAGGVATINDTPVSLALKVGLTSKTYAAAGTFSVAVASGIRNKTDTVKVTLYQVVNGTATAVLNRTAIYNSNNPPSYTMANLKYGTSYRLIAESFQGAVKQSTDTASTLNFTLPAPTNNQLEADVNVLLGALSVPCNK